MTTGSQTPSFSDRPLPRRSETQKIAGVAEGLGDAIGLDPSLVRIAFAALALASGAGLILYIGAWLLMLPPEPQVGIKTTESIGERPTPALIFGGVLLGVGLLVGLMTLDGFNPLPATIIGLIFVGLVLLNRTSESARTMMGQTSGAVPPPPIVPPPPMEIPPPGFMPGVFPAPSGDPNPTASPAPTPWPPPAVEPIKPLEVPAEAEETSVFETSEAEFETSEAVDSTDVLDKPKISDDTDGSDESGPDKTESFDKVSERANVLDKAEPSSEGPDNTEVLDKTELKNQLPPPPPAAPSSSSSSSSSPSPSPSSEVASGSQTGETTEEPTAEEKPANRIPKPSVGPTLPLANAVTENFIEQDIRQLETELAGADFGPLGAQEANLSDDLNRAHWALARTEHETTLTTENNRYNPGPPLASITLAALAMLTGIGLVFNTLIGETVKAATLAGVGTAAVGVAIAISAFTGRTIRLIPIAIVSLLILLASPFIDFAAADGIGSSEIRVSSLETLQDEYGVGIGYLELRLDDLIITEDTEIDVNVGVGSMEVTVPADTNVELRGRTKAGYIFLLDGERAGLDQSYTRIPGGRADTESPTLIINAETTIGELSIYRARD